MRRPDWARGRRPTVVILGGWFSRLAEIFIRTGIIIIELILVAVGCWVLGLGVHLRMDSPLLEAFPYTQLRPVPISFDERHVKIASKKSVGRHIARSNTISSILYRSAMSKFEAVVDHSEETISNSGSILRDLLITAESGWSALLYSQESGDLTLSLVDPSYSRRRVCRFHQYTAKVKPMIHPRWETEYDPDTGLPMNIPGTSDWGIKTIHIMSGRCSYVAGSANKKMIAMSYETVKDQAKVIMLRLYRVDSEFKFPEVSEATDPKRLEKSISCGSSCTELRLRGSLPLRTAEWVFNTTCLLYGRQDDVVEFRSICFFDSPDGLYYDTRGMTGPRQSYSRSSYIILLDSPVKENKSNTILGVRVASQNNLAIDIMHGGGGGGGCHARGDFDDNATSGSLWEAVPQSSRCWDVETEMSSIAVDDVYLYERQLKASSPEGNFFALTLVTDAVVIYDVQKLIDGNGTYEPMELLSTPLQRSFFWSLTPLALRLYLLNLWHGSSSETRQASYLRRHQRAELSSDGVYLCLITRQAVFLFKSGLCGTPDKTCWTPYWSLHRDRTRIGLGRNLDVYETTFLTSEDGKKTFLGVLFEEGVFATYFLGGSDSLISDPPFNWGALFSYGGRCIVAFAVTRYFSSVVDPQLFSFVMFLVLFVDLPGEDDQIANLLSSYVDGNTLGDAFKELSRTDICINPANCDLQTLFGVLSHCSRPIPKQQPLKDALRDPQQIYNFLKERQSPGVWRFANRFLLMIPLVLGGIYLVI
eukprot:TRINITY_DN3475_c0_g1_i1.p1 TRINITY_DN3475_c0_g1~~TRINITY_DN3475_c0_g1_i1.p1  ORF type:complete len:776 (+),score=99.95 TRINITY_DN3475_c0_g1_i1:52-2328(+)